MSRTEVHFKAAPKRAGIIVNVFGKDHGFVVYEVNKLGGLDPMTVSFLVKGEWQHYTPEGLKMSSWTGTPKELAANLGLPCKALHEIKDPADKRRLLNEAYQGVGALPILRATFKEYSNSNQQGSFVPPTSDGSLSERAAIYVAMQALDPNGTTPTCVEDCDSVIADLQELSQNPGASEGQRKKIMYWIRDWRQKARIYGTDFVSTDRKGAPAAELRRKAAVREESTKVRTSMKNKKG